MKYDIVVVGAGASGLAAAWFCLKGYSVVIIEQGKYITKESMISLYVNTEVWRI